MGLNGATLKIILDMATALVRTNDIPQSFRERLGHIMLVLLLLYTPVHVAIAKEEEIV